jgi:16S rRNA (cytidine1402-2'-O)-methyltransferase
MLGDRPSVVARELTKLHEEFIRGTLSEIIIPEARGEMVLLIGPPLEPLLEAVNPSEPRSILEEVEAVMRDEGLDRKSALKRVARARRISKSEAYRLALAEEKARGLE